MQQKVPSLLRQKGVYFSAVGLGGIFWAVVVWHMHEGPRATAILISLILIGAFVAGLLFQKRVWCRYLCPLGGLVGSLSRCSLLEMRANQSMCNNECQEHTCCIEDEDHTSCPMFEAPFTQESN